VELDGCRVNTSLLAGPTLTLFVKVLGVVHVLYLAVTLYSKVPAAAGESTHWKCAGGPPEPELALIVAPPHAAPTNVPLLSYRATV
jgi:hypothetical protein